MISIRVCKQQIRLWWHLDFAIGRYDYYCSTDVLRVVGQVVLRGVDAVNVVGLPRVAVSYRLSYVWVTYCMLCSRLSCVWVTCCMLCGRLSYVWVTY